MDALTFIWVSFFILIVIGSVIAVAVENAVERKEELKKVKRENRKLINENEYLKLMNELKGVRCNNAK